MPLGRHHVGDEPFGPSLVVDQLGEQMAQIPVEEDAADVEDHALANQRGANHACSRHAKAPPEASDGVTLTRKCARDICPGRTLSPGGDRKRAVWGKEVSVRVDLGGRSSIKKKTQ